MNKCIENPFWSFWMAGFECSDQLNVHGDRVDMIQLTSHHYMLDQDYDQLRQFNMRVVREGVQWSKVEVKPYRYDFSAITNMLAAGRSAGIQQVWDLCHFGYPADISPLHPHFCSRFEALCSAFGNFYKMSGENMPLIVTPINEVSFISWLGGDVAATSPFCRNNGWEVKYNLMKAYIAGIRALKYQLPQVRIMTTEPLISVSAAVGATDQQIQHANWHHQLQYQVLDMLAGKVCPELGGCAEYLDILGFNYYYDNQWTLEPHSILGWADPAPHPNYKPLHLLLQEAHQRYDRPVLLSETSHPGVDRPLWIKYISVEIIELLKMQVPFWGACIYPVIDRPDWDNTAYWHHSGVWDHCGTNAKRVLHQPTADMLLSCRQKVAEAVAMNINNNKYSVQSTDQKPNVFAD